MTTEASSIRSNLTGTKSGVKSTGVATLSDILAKCMAVYDSNNQVKDSIQAYRCDNLFSYFPSHTH